MKNQNASTGVGLNSPSDEARRTLREQISELCRDADLAGFTGPAMVLATLHGALGGEGDRLTEGRSAITPIQSRLDRQATPAALDSNLTGPEQRILNAIAWMESIGVTCPEQTAVAFLAGYTIGGGGFNNPRGSLRTKGLVEYAAGERIALTDAGRQSAQFQDAVLTSAELHTKVLERLPGPERKILIPLLRAYPEGMTNDELSREAGYTDGGGGYNNPRGRLRTLGLIEYVGGKVRARDLLFLEGR